MSPMALALLSALWTLLVAFGMVFAVLTGVAVAHLLATAAVLAVGWFAADAAIACLRHLRAWRDAASRNSCVRTARGARAAAEAPPLTATSCQVRARRRPRAS